MESRLAGQGWSCGVNESVAVKREKMDGGNKTEDEVRVGTAQQAERM